MYYGESRDRFRILNAFLIAFIATIVTYYSYSLFGLSASKLAKEFMPTNTPENQLLFFFIIFNVSVLVKPLGSILFGFLSDYYGRVFTIKIASIFVALSTAAIGLLPNFDVIGIWSVFGILILRIVFFMSVPGEVDILKIHILEKTSKLSTCALMGIACLCSQFGVLIAAYAYYLSYYYDGVSNQFWRINFIIGGICGIVVSYLSFSLIESKAFAQYKATKNPTQIKQDIREDSSNLIKKFILISILHGSLGGIYHFVIIFFPSFIMMHFLEIGMHLFEIEKAYNPHLFAIRLVTLYLLSAAVITVLCSLPVIQTKINDLLHKRTSLIILFNIVIVLFCIFYSQLIILVYCTAMLYPLYSIPLQIKMQQAFGIRLRTRMYSTAHSVGSIVFSASTPMFCMLMWRNTHSVLFVFTYLVLLLLVLLVCCIKAFHKDSYVR